MTRKEKGIEIATKLNLSQQKNKTWLVPSQSGRGKYVVNVDAKPQNCTCPDFEINRAKCKHIFAVEFTLQKQQGPNQAVNAQTLKAEKLSQSKKAKPTYSQKWTEYNQAQTNQKPLFQEFLHQLCQSIEVPQRPRGRGRPSLSTGEAIFCGAVKVYSLFSSRLCAPELKDAQAKGYISRAPHFNTVIDYLGMKEMTPFIQQLIIASSLPLAGLESVFAPDSSGFSTSKYVSWFNTRYGHEQDNHDWIKLHIMCGVTTNIITSAKVTGRHDHDSPVFPHLLKTTARNFNIKEVVADKGYSSKGNLELVVRKGATPYIPFKTSATGALGGVWEKLYHYFHMHRDEFLLHYHQRSNVESVFSMIKRRFLPNLRSRTETAQINELLLKVLCHNICVVIASMFEFGLKPTLKFDASQVSIDEPEDDLEEYPLLRALG
jgi:transposase/predicted nucleic acid-binding Zn finger protein